MSVLASSAVLLGVVFTLSLAVQLAFVAYWNAGLFDTSLYCMAAYGGKYCAEGVCAPE